MRTTNTAFFLAVLIAGGTVPAFAEDCAGLRGQKLGGEVATITDAKVVAATDKQAEHCLVTVSMNDSTLRFESRLPTSGWNRKLVFLGGGGFRGALFDPERPFFSASIRSERYATMVTNGGYDYPSAEPGARDATYFKAEFAYDAVKLADFTYLSEHRTLPLGKELIRRFYGSAPSKSYFEGCSSGGHDAMMLSQRWPDDFDGIVARAPAGNFIGLHMQFNRIAKAVRNPAGMLNPAKQKLLADAVLAQCDKLDGVEDGIISKPSACNYDATALRCEAGADTGDSCLSDAQIATVKTVTTPIATSDGTWSHPGYNFGAENSAKGWGEYVWVNPKFLGGETVQGAFSDGFIRSFVTRDPNFDTKTWDANQWMASLSIIGAMYEAFDPDLTRLKAHGAKLILWNGTNDTAVSARDTARYYERVVEKLGREAADETVELFLASGVGHCFGGVGPDQVDLLKALVTWVEQGKPPSQQGIVLAKRTPTGETTMTRPMCKYPAYPRYKGTGDINAAESFSCSTE
jgi:pimeloyl-ACP methyl ester carboxylesterase